MKKPSSRFHGNIVLISFIFFGIFATMTGSFANTIISSARIARIDTESTQALHLAEAGIDRAISALNQNTNYSGEVDTALGSGVFTVVVTTSGNQKVITSTGYVPNSASPRAEKSVRVTAGIDTSVVSFRYGVQAGAGGFSLTGGAVINGNVYANGDINAATGVSITGSAVVADPPAVYVDQSNVTPIPISSCTSSTCITFGNANGTEDFAQKFRLSSSVRSNKVEFYIKKVGAPNDADVRIVTDSAGKPSTTIILSGVLEESAVSTNFEWVEVSLPSTPTLTSGKDYWLVIDADSSASKYYILGANEDGYPAGSSAIGRYSSSWASTTPSTLDGYFRLSLGGGNGLLGGTTNVTGVSVGSEGGNATAHTAMGVTSYGTLYCQTGNDTNKECSTNYPVPTPQPMPITDSQINAWKEDAEAGGVIDNGYTVGPDGATLGPKKIVGDLTIGGGGLLIISGTIWVTGKITISGGGDVALSPSYGSQSGTIVTDGRISLSGNASFAGSGTSGSYPFIITTSACPNDTGCGNAPAITLTGGAGAIALVAQNGTATVNGGGALKALTAQTIEMTGGATLTYDNGLISTEFLSGNGGSWAFLPGTYTILP
jgi:hypothetical protein